MTQRKASPETMARLCEAFVEWANIQEPPGGPNRMRCWLEKCQPALSAYRAETTPPLRSRAAKALDLLETLEIYMTISETSEWSNSLGPLWTQIEEIVGEPTAPEPAPSAEPYRVHDLRNTFTNHDQDTREERPCGCEEAEALKDQLVECKRLLAFAHERAREIVQALGGVVP